MSTARSSTRRSSRGRFRNTSPAPPGARPGRAPGWTARPARASRSRSSPRCAPRTRSRCTCALRSATGSRRRRSSKCSSTPRSTPASPRRTAPWRSRTRRSMNERGEHFVQSLERGLAVIRAFGPEDPELTLSDVARRTGLTRAAARRFLLTLADLGYVRSDDRRFALTPRVLELGYASPSSLPLPEVAEPHLERLAAEVRESSSVSVLDGGDIVYVARVPVSGIMPVSINVGTRFPAYATSMGRVLLSGLDDEALDAYLGAVELARLSPKTVSSTSALRAELERVRTQGWAIVDQEL